MNNQNYGPRHMPVNMPKNMSGSIARNIPGGSAADRPCGDTGNRPCEPSCGSPVCRNAGNKPCDNAGSRMGRQGKADQSCYMKSIYELGFQLTEAILYLDTHPDDKEALAFYMNVKEKLQEVVAAYAREYGPINYFTNENPNYWTWVKTPMPWEMEGC